MKHVSSLKATKNDSPKTPGGISKSLLTPCRRVGLSRNWKKAGPSPFVSPLSGGNVSQEETKVEKKETRKRKTRVESDETEEQKQCTPETHSTKVSVLNDDGDETVPSRETEDLSNTPTRHTEVPRKKKSKTLLSGFSNNRDSQNIEPAVTKEPSVNIYVESKSKENHNVQERPQTTPSVSTLSQKSKSKAKKVTSPKTSKVSTSKHDPKDKINEEIEIKENISDSKDQEKVKDLKGTEDIKPTSPKELTKECIVVLQKKIFKTDKKASKKEKDGVKSQTLFDSDSDDVPLGQLNKQKVESPKILAEKNVVKAPEIINLDEDDDFTDNKKVKVKKIDRATSIGGLKKKPVKNSKLKTLKPVVIPSTIQTIDDDDDDFDFNDKKTILIRKTYEKVIKPQRAKTTGSITQKDIDELRAKIEVKKKLLLAKAMTEDTEELRSLIKKWQKGCQDALMELMELMKNKFPDKKDMDYSEMLSMLRIPANLVGYDDENDCFNTPEDSNIVLSKFNDF